MLWIEAIGLVGGALSCASFVPQLLKLWRERTAEGLSRRMYMVTVTAFTVWTLYGVLTERWAVIIANAVCLVLSGSILALQVRFSRARGTRRPRPGG